MQKVSLIFGNIQIEADLYDTPTAEAITKILPVTSRTHTWGDEVYFEIPIQIDLESDARAVVKVGELGYWPAGRAFCVFFGPTPVSTDGQPQAASAVNVFGKVTGNLNELKQIRSGDIVEVRLSE